MREEKGAAARTLAASALDFSSRVFFRDQLSRCLARLLLAALTCTLIPSFPHPTLLLPRGIRMRGEPEPSFEVFLPLFAPRASPLNILSVNLSKQAHFFWCHLSE